jgi:hypothetical protein
MEKNTGKKTRAPNANASGRNIQRQYVQRESVKNISRRICPGRGPQINMFQGEMSMRRNVRGNISRGYLYSGNLFRDEMTLRRNPRRHANGRNPRGDISKLMCSEQGHVQGDWSGVA